jgi:hypothetical protein
MTDTTKIGLLLWTLIVFVFNQALFAVITFDIVTAQAEVETPDVVFVVTALCTLVFTSTCAAVGVAITCYIKRIQKDSGAQ